MMKSDEEKFAVYEKLEAEHHGKIVMQEHSSGFPAVVISISGRRRYLTDCLSVEKWWRLRQGLKHYIIYPPEGCGASTGYRISAKTLDEAKEKAAKHFNIEASEIDTVEGWKIVEES